MFKHYSIWDPDTILIKLAGLGLHYDAESGGTNKEHDSMDEFNKLGAEFMKTLRDTEKVMSVKLLGEN